MHYLTRSGPGPDRQTLNGLLRARLALHRLLQLPHLIGMLLLLGMGAFQANGQAADSTPTLRRLDETSWNKSREGLDYSGQTPEEKPEQQKTPAQRPAWVKDLVVVLSYSLLGGLLLVLLWLAYRRLSPAVAPAKVSAGFVTEQDDPRHVLASDLDAQLALAWSEERYRDVLRYHFLAVMRALSLGGFIAWRPEKTNRDYELDLAGQIDLRSTYRRLSAVFEWSRYGDAAVSRQDAEQWSPLFSAFLERLKQPMAKGASSQPLQPQQPSQPFHPGNPTQQP